MLYTRDTNGKLVVISSKESNNAFAPGGSDSVYQDDFLNTDATSYSESDAEAMIENDGGSADADLFDTTIPAPDAGFRHRSGAELLDDVE